ncbi:MAG: hypothetical protein FWB86_02120 [Treponema sp.]|nr:hypothetical protein [Treponema sp.]
MVEPKEIELSKEIIDKLKLENIIYAEYAEPGAMGNSGGVIIYAITDNNFNCYLTNIRQNENLYALIIDILEGNIIDEGDEIHGKGIFRLFYCNYGNYVFINKDISLKIGLDHFIFTSNNLKYIIDSSVEGVFNMVSNIIQNENYGIFAGFSIGIEKLSTEETISQERFIKWVKEDGFRELLIREMLIWDKEDDDWLMITSISDLFKEENVLSVFWNWLDENKSDVEKMYNKLLEDGHIYEFEKDIENDDDEEIII